MKAFVTTLAAASMLMLAGQASAVDAKAAEALAQKSGCLACHTVNNKVVGPSYKDVAAKYKGDKNAEAKLIEKVKKGGSGVWGPIPMPPNSPHVKDQDIKTIVQWILTMK
ncbi:MAG TPA: c-type cytochrome [Methylophilaceae bacterium]|nr:c-type cytochrome [Methylophilaceae bacterium]